MVALGYADAMVTDVTRSDSEAFKIYALPSTPSPATGPLAWQ